MAKKKIKVYACGVDYQHELGNTTNTVYGSVESLKKDAKCWKGCGIVELELTIKKWVVPQDMEEMCRNAVPAGEVNKRMIEDVKAKIKAQQAFLERLEAQEKKDE